MTALILFLVGGFFIFFLIFEVIFFFIDRKEKRDLEKIIEKINEIKKGDI